MNRNFDLRSLADFKFDFTINPRRFLQLKNDFRNRFVDSQSRVEDQSDVFPKKFVVPTFPKIDNFELQIQVFETVDQESDFVSFLVVSIVRIVLTSEKDDFFQRHRFFH